MLARSTISAFDPAILLIRLEEGHRSRQSRLFVMGFERLEIAIQGLRPPRITLLDMQRARLGYVVRS